MLLVKNLLTQWETEEENRTWDQSMKNISTDEGNGEENRKIIKYKYCQWKNLPTWSKDRERNTEVCGERKNLVKLRYCSVFSGVELPIVKQPNAGSPMLPSPGKQISSYPPASGSRKSNWLRFLLVTSLGVLCGAFCWSSSFPLCKELDCWYCWWKKPSNFN